MSELIDDLTDALGPRPWHWPSPLEADDAGEVEAALTRLRERHPDLPASATWLMKAKFFGALDGGMRLDEDLDDFAARVWLEALTG